MQFLPSAGRSVRKAVLKEVFRKQYLALAQHSAILAITHLGPILLQEHLLGIAHVGYRTQFLQTIDVDPSEIDLIG